MVNCLILLGAERGAGGHRAKADITEIGLSAELLFCRSLCAHMLSCAVHEIHRRRRHIIIININYLFAHKEEV